MKSGPTVTDSFDTGDYRNFAPVYLGPESDWIRPTVTVSTERPISGEYSLRWSANDDPHRWALVSNAFHLESPLEASVSVRIDGPADEPFTAGLGIAETKSRASIVRATESGLELTTTSWDGEPTAMAPVSLSRGDVYELSLSLEDGSLAAALSDDDGEIARLEAETGIEPNALALYVDTIAGGGTTLTFDDVAVESVPYRVRDGEWTRSSPFVVLPRSPDVDEDQGNWVGAPSIIDEGDRYRMWYRIRNNEDRGAGYGLAESRDGIDWQKHDENPVLFPDLGQDSNEGISVLEVDGVYHTWYTINRDGTWHVVYGTSEDGIEWEEHGIVIEGYCKDPIVLHVDGTFYLYAIAPSNTQFSVFTSADGRDWTRKNTIDLGSHGHPGAYYVEETETFWLYAFAEEGSASPVARVRRAASDDGIHFDDLEPTWHDPEVGIDCRPTGGIDYGAFPGDEHGHLSHDRRVLMYYQARHDYLNNRPGWRKAGDGLVVLAGQFTGLFEGVSTTVDGDGYAYHEFPTAAASIRGLDVSADEPTTITVDRWGAVGDSIGRGTIEAENETSLSVSLTGLEPDREYAFSIGDATETATTDADGAATFEVTCTGGASDEFELTAL